MKALNAYGVLEDVEEGDLFCEVDSTTFEITTINCGLDFEPKVGVLYFVTLAAAEKYVYWNKPVHSRLEMQNANVGGNEVVACLGCGTYVNNGYCMCNNCNKVFSE